MRRVLILISASLFPFACQRTQPIVDVEDAEIFTGSGKTPTTQQVQKAILQAVVAKTWRVTKKEVGRIEARFAKGDKVARIAIDYSPKSYSIRYVSSALLLYNEGSIHRRYNAWVRGLRVTIDRNLAKL